MNKQVTVFGAGGRVGRLVVELLLEQDVNVVAAVHRPKQFPQHELLKIVSVDIYDASSVEQAIKGSDAVVSALGSWGTKRKDVLTVGIDHVIKAMQAHGIMRVVSVTGADARAAGDTLSLIHKLTHLALSVVASKILRDGERHIVYLEDSSLDWTVVRSPIMSSNETVGAGQLTTKRPFPWQKVSYRYVAEAMVASLDDTAWIRQAPYIR